MKTKKMLVMLCLLVLSFTYRDFVSFVRAESEPQAYIYIDNHSNYTLMCEVIERPDDGMIILYPGDCFTFPANIGRNTARCAPAEQSSNGLWHVTDKNAIKEKVFNLSRKEDAEWKLK